MIEYRLHTRVLGGDFFRSYAAFVEAVELELKVREFVHLVMEPGDCTRYEFIIINSHKATIMAYVSEITGWAVVTGPYMEPGDFISHNSHNSWTATVAAQLLADIRRQKVKYFNFKVGAPY